MLIFALPFLYLTAAGTLGCDPGIAAGEGIGADVVDSGYESTFRASMLVPEGVDFNTIHALAYEAPESGDLDPTVDPLAGEDMAVINPAIPIVTVDMLLAPGRYYMVVTFLKPDGTVSEDCAPIRTEVFEVIPHEQTEIQLDAQCAPADGAGYVAVGVRFVAPTVFITDLEQDYHWNVCGGVTRIFVTAEDLAGLAFGVTLHVTDTPELDPGSFYSVQEVGFGEYLLYANQPGTYAFQVKVVNELGAFDYINATVVFEGEAACNAGVLTCEEPAPIDLTQDLPLPFDAYTCPDAVVTAMNAEQAIEVEGCGEPITVSASDPAQMLVVLKGDLASGMSPEACIAWADSGVGVVTFDTEAGVRYLVVAEQAGFGFETELTRTGCCP